MGVKWEVPQQDRTQDEQAAGAAFGCDQEEEGDDPRLGIRLGYWWALALLGAALYAVTRVAP